VIAKYLNQAMDRVPRNKRFTAHGIFVATSRYLLGPVFNGRTCTEFSRGADHYSPRERSPVASRIPWRRHTPCWSPNLIPQRHVLEHNLARLETECIRALFVEGLK